MVFGLALCVNLALGAAPTGAVGKALDQDPDAGVQPTAGPSAQAMAIEVGKTVSAPVPGAAVCDNLKVIDVVDKGDHLELTGVKVGSSTCAFRRTAQSPAVVLQIEVIVPKKKAPEPNAGKSGSEDSPPPSH